jgi:hypothetical protein
MDLLKPIPTGELTAAFSHHHSTTETDRLPTDRAILASWRDWRIKGISQSTPEQNTGRKGNFLARSEEIKIAARVPGMIELFNSQVWKSTPDEAIPPKEAIDCFWTLLRAKYGFKQPKYAQINIENAQ